MLKYFVLDGKNKIIITLSHFTYKGDESGIVSIISTVAMMQPYSKFHNVIIFSPQPTIKSSLPAQEKYMQKLIVAEYYGML